MSNTIAGNVAGATGKTVYLVQRHTAYSSAYSGTSPQQAVTDGSGNYSFTVTKDGPYRLYTVASMPNQIRVDVAGNNIADVNFAA